MSATPPRSPLSARLPVLFLAVLGLAAAGCESARRPVPQNPVAREKARSDGRLIVERACAAAGGYERWKAMRDVSFRLDDRWTGATSRMLRPWPVEHAEGPFAGTLGPLYGSVQVTAKEGPVTYGVGAGGPWAMHGTRPSSEPGDLATARSTVPVYLFHFELPFAFLNDDAVQHYMGIQPAPPGGPVYEVLVTYPWYTGDRSHDWYVARFDTSSMRLRSVTYTSSLWGPAFIEYTDEVGNFAQFDSLWVPTRHQVRMSFPFRPDLHAWTVGDVRFNSGLGDSTFRGPAKLGGGGT